MQWSFKPAYRTLTPGSAEYGSEPGRIGDFEAGPRQQSCQARRSNLSYDRSLAALSREGELQSALQSGLVLSLSQV